MRYIDKWFFFLAMQFFISCFASNRELKNLDECSANERDSILKSQVYINSKHFSALYQAVYDLQQLFEIGGIRYVTLFGAALGILRSKELIPWDGGVDFGVTLDQEKSIQALIPLAYKLGYSIFSDDISGYKFCKNEPLVDEANGKQCNVSVDVCLYRPYGENYVLARYKGRQVFPNSWLKKRELEEIEMSSCGPIKLPCSRYAKDHLVRMYGEHCVEIGHFYFSHMLSSLLPIQYIWSIENVASYPIYKNVKLENRVRTLLDSIPGVENALELSKKKKGKKIC